jgi:hypothetical protein
MQIFRLNKILPLLFILATLPACKKGVPEVTSLKSLSGFSVDQSTVSTSSKTTPAFTISGKCNAKFNDVQVSTDGGTNWISASQVSTLTFNCADTGSFTADISFQSGALDSQKWSSADNYSGFMVRGSSNFGFSDPIAVTLTNVSRGMPGTVTAGASNPMIGGNYKLKGELTSYDTSPAMAGGSYKMQGEVTW